MTTPDSDSESSPNPTDTVTYDDRYEKIFKHSNDAIMIVDVDTDSFVDVNPAACEILGYSRQELLSLDPADIHPNDMDRVRDEFLRQVYEEGSGWTDELTCITKSGETVPTEISGAILDDGDTDGDPSRMVAMLRDVTERKEREQELQQSFNELEGILNSLNDLVFLHEADGSMRYVNDSAISRLGYSEDNLMTKTPQELVTQDDRGKYDELIKKIKQEGSVTFEATLQTVNGDEIPVEINVSKTRFHGDLAFLSVARDISDRKEQKQALRRFKKAVEQTAHAVYITDIDGTIEYINGAFEEQTGYSAEEAIGQTPHILNSGTHEKAFFADLWETILSGEVWEQEVINERADGSEYYIDQTIAPIQNDTGEIEAFVAVNTEITDRKELEQQLTEQRDNLDVLNQVLRHDVRNDLQVVTGYGTLLADHIDEESEAYEHLETLLESAEHAVELTRTARDMATVMLESADDRQPVALREILERELNDFRSTYSEAVVTVDDPAPEVRVTANEMLDSVFRNLLKNAIQHNDKEVPKVDVSAFERGDDVIVQVADNGPGIPDDKKEEIFGKGEKGLDSQGTGLGLFLVKTLIEGFGGNVWVEDRPKPGAENRGMRSDDSDRYGAVFVVKLPIASV
jgi:PAS domain S-box-containing protein